jgi:hypothetical protein
MTEEPFPPVTVHSDMTEYRPGDVLKVTTTGFAFPDSSDPPGTIGLISITSMRDGQKSEIILGLTAGTALSLAAQCQVALRLNTGIPLSPVAIEAAVRHLATSLIDAQTAAKEADHEQPT